MNKKILSAVAAANAAAVAVANYQHFISLPNKSFKAAGAALRAYERVDLYAGLLHRAHWCYSNDRMELGEYLEMLANQVRHNWRCKCH